MLFNRGMCLIGTVLAVDARRMMAPTSEDSEGQINKWGSIERGFHNKEDPNLLSWYKQFSGSNTGAEIAYTRALRDSYGSNASITATNGRLFDISGFANDPANGLKLSIQPGSILQRQFVEMPKRSQGPGQLVTVPTFLNMKASYLETKFDIVLGRWTEGFDSYEVYWIINTGEMATEEASKQSEGLIMAVGIWTRQLRRQIWSFQSPGFWIKSGELWGSIQEAAWEDIIMNATLKNNIRGDAEGFFKKRKVYEDLKVPYKRGIILHGAAGNGKTITIKALIKYATVPALYVRTFTRFGSDLEGIKEIFEKARAEAPCLLIIEDLDSLVTDQNRSAFLNEVDGMSSNDGVLIIATTNHLDRIDGAISNRPSRFDRKYLIDNPVLAERKQYAEYWQAKLHNRPELHFNEDLVESFAKETGDFSFAYLKESFVSSLLLIAGGDERAFSNILHEQISALRAELRTSPEPDFHSFKNDSKAPALSFSFGQSVFA